MTFTLEQFQSALSQYESRCGEKESAVDVLFYCYCIASPGDDGLLRKAESGLWEAMADLPPQASDAIFDRVSGLCLAGQRAAFLDGVRVGAELRRLLVSEHP